LLARGFYLTQGIQSFRFVNQFLDPDVPVSEIADDPIAETEAHEFAENPKIKAPRDMFGGARLSAKGRDLAQYNEIKRARRDFQDEGH